MSDSFTDSRYESVATIASRPEPRRTKTPVSTGRDSSRPAALPTHAIASSSGSASSDDVGAPSTSGSRGKSSTAYVRSRYEAEPLVTSSVFSSAWYSISTSSAGSWRTMSPSSLPGTTALPSPSTSASSPVRIESSMSVADSSSLPAAACMSTPAKI